MKHTKCKDCGTEEEDLFYPYKRYVCKPCHIVRNRNKREENLRKLQEYVGVQCVDCGLVDDWAVYDFHHEDPSEKEMHVSQVIGHSWNKLKAEADKCVLLCSNCHRKRHAEERRL